MKHTPGPWGFVRTVQRYFCDGYGPYGMERYGIKIGDRVVFIHGQDFPWQKGDREQQEWQANARLIAAAPDMLEVLENIENDDAHIPATIWDLIQKAIAKAKGENQ